VTRVAFGDLFLEDIRSYREKRLAEIGMRGIFPLWHRDTTRLARRFIRLGFRAVTCCVDPKQIPKEFCGIPYDGQFLDRLPEGVDPCGENGEFHTFVYDGPLFSRPVEFDAGEVVLRQGFYFADLVPRSD
jgi:diphthamide synthase (EF-2-diphthine--ammonia ligase)